MPQNSALTSEAIVSSLNLLLTIALLGQTPTYVKGPLVLGGLASDPASPANGWMYFNSTSKKFRCWIDAGWRDCGAVTATQVQSVASTGTGAQATFNLDPAERVIALTCLDPDGCVGTMQDTSAFLSKEATICSTSESVGDIYFPLILGLFAAPAKVSVQGTAPGECFEMAYVDATDDLWVVSGTWSNEGLPPTGGTLTGQVVFSAVTTDISTDTNEHLTLAPNGSGNVLVASADVIVSGAGSQLVEVDVDSGSANVAVHTDSASGAASFWAWNNAKTLIVSNIGYFGPSYSVAAYQDKTLWYSLGKTIEINQYNNIAAGSDFIRFTDNTIGTTALLMSIDGGGRVIPLLYGSQTNCSDGAGPAACSAAPAGSVVIGDGNTDVVVSTTAVTANSQIIPVFDSSLGTKLGVTCNTTYTAPYISARIPASSFTITAPDPAGADPACFSYFITN